MSQRFRVHRWAAWAPGLDTTAAWRGWLSQPHALPEAGQPPLADMPAMMRRRIEPLGRAALQAAYWAQADTPAGTLPMVFASRWGELARSLVLLQQLAGGEPLSPTHFSLSVHNAVGALYSMARQDRQHCVAVAAGAHSADAGVCEALGLLADGAPQVLVVSFDAPLPPPYADRGEAEPHEIEPMLHGWACVLAPAHEGEAAFSLEAVPPCDKSSPAGRSPTLPGSLAVLDFLSMEGPDAAPVLHRPGPQGGWRWTRHDQ